MRLLFPLPLPFPQSATAYALSAEFDPVLKQRMAFFSSNPSADTISRVQGASRTIRCAPTY